MSNKRTVDISSTPLIPQGVYENLPRFLKECCSYFIDNRQRDVFLTASWGVLGGSFSNVQGRYSDGTLYPGLYVIIAAPPASGKGTLSLVKRLARPLHKSLSRNPTQPITQENQEENAEQRKPHAEVEDKLLFLPADISSAMFIELLEKNGGRGILFETEADTLVNTLKQEWGYIDANLRAGFQHEAISLARKTDKRIIKIEVPKLSMVLSGTLGQIISLIQSTDNGLFSRFIFYVYRQDFKWRDVTPCYNCPNPEDVYLKKGEELLEIVKFTEAHPMEFILSAEQWVRFNKYFVPIMREYPTIHGDDAAGVIARMGIITFRLAMILSIVRRWESKNPDPKLQCSDQDFTIAFQLAEIYSQHALVMMKLLPGANDHVDLDSKDELYKDLPLSFTRSEAVNIGGKKNNGVSTVDHWLKGWLCEKKLIQLKQGHYKKPE
jgi:hypothetical protein